MGSHRRPHRLLLTQMGSKVAGTICDSSVVCHRLGNARVHHHLGAQVVRDELHLSLLPFQGSDDRERRHERLRSMERQLELAALGRGLRHAVGPRLAGAVLPALNGVVGRPGALERGSARGAVHRRVLLRAHFSVADLALLADRSRLIALDFSSPTGEAAGARSLASWLGGRRLRELPAEEGEERVDGDLRGSGSHGWTEGRREQRERESEVGDDGGGGNGDDNPFCRPAEGDR